MIWRNILIGIQIIKKIIKNKENPTRQILFMRNKSVVFQLKATSIPEAATQPSIYDLYAIMML